LGKLFKFPPLTARDKAAPNLLDVLSGDGTNDGPASVTIPDTTPDPARLAHSAARPPNAMQGALSTAAAQLPTLGANIGAHIQRLTATPDPAPIDHPVGAAAAAIAGHIKAWLGK
jgi:hypothetical protein